MKLFGENVLARTYFVRWNTVVGYLDTSNIESAEAPLWETMANINNTWSDEWQNPVQARTTDKDFALKLHDAYALTIAFENGCETVTFADDRLIDLSDATMHVINYLSDNGII